MWKVGGTKIERTGARYIFFMCVHGNSRKSNFLGKTLRTRKFSTKKIFGAATSGILTHSGFRKYSLFGWPSLCYRGSKSGHRPKTGRVQRCDSAIFLERREHRVPISESLFYSFPSSRTKIGGVTLICQTEITSRQILKRGSTSPARNSALKTPYPLCHTYSEPSGH